VPFLALFAVLSPLCLWLWPASASARPFDTNGEDWEGLSQLVRLAETELGAHRVVRTSTLSLADLRREDALLLVHPVKPIDVDELVAFMRAGGRIVLLDDYGTGDELLARFGIRRVPLPAHPAQMLRQNPSFALADAVPGHTAVRDVGQVVTNHATGLDHPALSKLLVVRGAHLEGSVDEPDVWLALAGTVGQGRLIAVGDASIGINSMLRYPGNRALCSALVRYAADDDASAAHDGKLYVLTNDFDTTGAFGSDSAAAGALSAARRALVDALEALRQGGMPPLAAYLGAIAVGLGIVIWTSAHAGKTHKAILPRFVRPTAPADQGGVAGRAAVVGAPGTSRVLAMLELKSALEEQLATRLGLDRVPSQQELVAGVRAAGLLDDEKARLLSTVLGSLARIETMLVMHRRGVTDRVRDADVLEMAARVEQLLAAARGPRNPYDARMVESQELP
jgi:hypothetical protein